MAACITNTYSTMSSECTVTAGTVAACSITSVSSRADRKQRGNTNTSKNLMPSIDDIKVNEDTIYRFAVYASTRIGAGPSDEVTARTDEYCKLLYSNVLEYQVCYIATTLCQECCI